MAAPLSFAFDLTFDEAIAASRARGVVLPREFYDELQSAARANAFTVSTIESLSQIQAIMDSLSVATAEGMTFREWQIAADAEIAGLTVAHAENVFRNAVQTAYSIGRTIQQRENADERPFLMWDAINDSRTRETHREMSGYVAPIDDPVWKVWSPPAGHNCRCTRIALTEEQARNRGYPMARPNVEPDPGFGYEKADGQAQLLEDLLARRAAQAPPKIRAAVEDVKP